MQSGVWCLLWQGESVYLPPPDFVGLFDPRLDLVIVLTSQGLQVWKNMHIIQWEPWDLSVCTHNHPAAGDMLGWGNSTCQEQDEDLVNFCGEQAYLCPRWRHRSAFGGGGGRHFNRSSRSNQIIRLCPQKQRVCSAHLASYSPMSKLPAFKTLRTFCF